MIPFETSPSICTQCHQCCQIFSLFLVPRTTEGSVQNTEGGASWESRRPDDSIYNSCTTEPPQSRPRGCRHWLTALGRGGFVVLASRWRSGVHLPGWTAAWWCGGGFNFVWSEWNAAWSLTFWRWSRELKILMVPCYTKFTSQVVSHHNACSSANSPKLKSRGLLLLTYSTVEDVCARKRTSTSQYQICKCKAKSLLVGRL